MKKVVNSVYTKLIAMVCILASVGILIYEAIEIADYEIEKEKAYDEKYKEVMDYDAMTTAVYDELIGLIEEIIQAYKDGGMNNIANEIRYYEAYNSHDIRNIDFVMADSSMIFFDGMEPIYISNYFEDEDALGGQMSAYREVEFAYEAFYDEAGVALYINNSGIEARLMYDFEYTRKEVELEEVLSEDSIQFLANNNNGFIMTIYSDYYYVSEMKNQYEEKYEQVIAGLEFETIDTQLLNRISIFIPCVMLIIVATIVLIFTCGKKADAKKELNYYERGYSELHIILIICLGMGIFWGTIGFFDIYMEMQGGYTDTQKVWVVRGVITAVCTGIVWFYYEGGIIIKKLINKRFLKDCLVMRILNRIKKWFLCSTAEIRCSIKAAYDSSTYASLSVIKRKYIRKIVSDIIMAIVMLMMIIMQLYGYGDYIKLVRKVNEWGYNWTGYTGLGITLNIFIWVIIIIYFVNSFLEYKDIRNNGKLIIAVDAIYDGDYNAVEIGENETNETLKKIANLSNSVEESVRKQVEAEKMQIELVANVSHDLKTPLTSIISYVDLLREEEMSDVAKDYVKVLVDKSARLKDIVADVFDLAKATSGEQVAMEQLDGVVLINQVLSDMRDRIEETGKDLRTKIQLESAPIRGNGQKLYRVFQNVIDNALKYSMPGTRIYINAEDDNGEFVVTIKNVSEFEIDYTAEEILSRFTRGDKARHSEGNGLGLSIAKSFTELCGGCFEVKLDDDVFMVVIKLR